MVLIFGFEPKTFVLSGRCSNQTELYQHLYFWCWHLGSNQGPSPYQNDALTRLSYTSIYIFGGATGVRTPETTLQGLHVPKLHHSPNLDNLSCSSLWQLLHKSMHLSNSAFAFSKPTIRVCIGGHGDGLQGEFPHWYWCVIVFICYIVHSRTVSGKPKSICYQEL